MGLAKGHGGSISIPGNQAQGQPLGALLPVACNKKHSLFNSMLQAPWFSSARLTFAGVNARLEIESRTHSLDEERLHSMNLLRFLGLTMILRKARKASWEWNPILHRDVGICA